MKNAIFTSYSRLNDIRIQGVKSKITSSFEKVTKNMEYKIT